MPPLDLADLQERRPAITFRSRHFHRTSGFANDLLRDGPEDEAFKTCEAFRSDHDLVRADLSREAQDLGGGFSDPRMHEEMHATGAACGKLLANLLRERVLDSLGIQIVDRALRNRRIRHMRVERADEVQRVLWRVLCDIDRSLECGSSADPEIICDDDLSAVGHGIGVSKSRATKSHRGTNAFAQHLRRSSWPLHSLVGLVPYRRTTEWLTVTPFVGRTQRGAAVRMVSPGVISVENELVVLER